MRRNTVDSIIAESLRDGSLLHRRRCNAAWLRAQLEGMAFTLSVREMTIAEVRDAVRSILDGRGWRVTP